MMRTTRRQMLAAGAVATPLAIGAARAELPGSSKIAEDLDRYVGFGSKRAGGAGDNACGEWLASELAALGYRVRRQTYGVPWFEESIATLACGGREVPVHPQPIVVTTEAGGVSGPLAYVGRTGRWSGAMRGRIAVLDLPHARWSSALARPFRDPVNAAFGAGAVAVVAITNGPSNEVVALNCDGREPMFAGPVVLLAPKHADSVVAAAIEGEAACLTVTGRGGTRPAFNFVGEIDRGKRRWLAVSTPRSGWFTCAGERGGGIAVWLDLARWARDALPDHDLAFVCNTGHEYEYLGAAEAMKAIAPPPSQTRLWLHLGANLAARGWHEVAGPVTALSSVDQQRYLSVTPDLLSLAQQSFAGQPGLEDPVDSTVLAAGELVEVLGAGYRPAAGTFGIHRFHHTPLDDQRCLNVPATVEAALAFRKFVVEVLRRRDS